MFGATLLVFIEEVGAEHAKDIVGDELGAYPTRFAVV
jgi:hypothetical protein